jgi:hypothetical protein
MVSGRRAVVAGVVAACLFTACTDGHAPDLPDLPDQTAVVGQQLTIELDGTDVDGDQLAYGVKADIMLQGATITETPNGSGLFRWTPLAEDVGMHVFDFYVSDGSHKTAVSVNVNVVSSIAGAPVFRQPLGTGTVLNVSTQPCLTVNIVIEDQDSAMVTIAQEPPVIDGAMLTQTGGLTGMWTWCPSAAQIGAADRYTLILSADDGTNPKTIKPFVIVLSSGGGPHIVLNELDYDNVGTDNAEYVEISNPSSSNLSLAGLALVLVNGSTNTVYNTIDLSSGGQLPAGGYLVVAGSTVTVPASAIKIDPVAAQDWLQNGSPDGVAIVDTVSHTLVDALSYEGAIISATIDGFPSPVSLVEGTVLSSAVADSNTVTGSLCRIPDGQDTNDANTDWKFCGTLTPGAANVQ